MYSSSTDSATLLSNGERIDPYEQRWVVRSVGLSAWWGAAGGRALRMIVPGDGHIGW